MIVTVTDLLDGVTPEATGVAITVFEGTIASTGGGTGAVDSVNGQTGVVVLGATDVGADASGAATSAVSTHAAASDPHPTYMTQAEGDAAYDALGAASAAQTAAIAAAATDATTKASAAQAAAIAASQPVDSDLTAIAALSTTAYGRAFLEIANAAAGRTALGLGTAAVAATGDFDAAGAAAAAQAASQPLDSDLTAIASLSTTAYGRSLLEAANASALRTLAGLVLGTDIYSKSAIDSGFAPLASPALTGNPTAPTPTAGDNDTSIATTAFVTTAVAGGGGATGRYKEVDLSGPDDFDFLGSDIAAGSTLETGWSWLDQGTLKYARGGGRGHLLSEIESRNYIRGMTYPFPSDWSKVTVLFDFAAQTFDVGLLMRNSANGKITNYGIRGAGSIGYNHWTSTTAWGGTTTMGTLGGHAGPIALSIKKTSATSYDLRAGSSYYSQVVHVSALNPQTFLGSEPDQFGIGFDLEGGGWRSISMEYVKFE